MVGVPSGAKSPPSKRTINKIFLIGNGFDLSLGLKTRYEDFLFWYFKRFILKSLTNHEYHNIPQTVYNHNEDSLFTFYNEVNYSYPHNYLEKFNEISDFSTIKNFILNDRYKFKWKFASTLFKSIFTSSMLGWVDIEKNYYDLLKSELKKKSETNIEKLNEDLKTIKTLIKEYLETLDYSISENNEIIIPYIHQFISEINPDEIIDEKAHLHIVTNQILLLNFNYTPTISKIIQAVPTALKSKFQNERCKLNHIHGIINNPDNDLIFGYGDEMDEDYSNIQNLNDNRYLENFKSFKYNHHNNYRDLLRFVNAHDYQVCIYGHSCGLSDRVMLNEIFEHDNCKSIKIYYHNKDEFINKNMEISRHFNSNKIMRQRIVEFNSNDQIPQMRNV